MSTILWPTHPPPSRQWDTPPWWTSKKDCAGQWIGIGQNSDRNPERFQSWCRTISQLHSDDPIPRSSDHPITRSPDLPIPKSGILISLPEPPMSNPNFPEPQSTPEQESFSDILSQYEQRHSLATEDGGKQL